MISETSTQHSIRFSIIQPNATISPYFIRAPSESAICQDKFEIFKEYRDTQVFVR